MSRAPYVSVATTLPLKYLSLTHKHKLCLAGSHISPPFPLYVAQTPSLPRDISRSLIFLSSYDSPCEISFSLANTKLRLSGSHLSLIFVCMSLTCTLSLSLSHPHT